MSSTLAVLCWPVVCTPASGWEKGQVENQVGLVRERFFAPRIRVKCDDKRNAGLLDQAIAYAKAHRHPEFKDQTVWQVFEAERASLVRYPGRFDGLHAVPASVSKTRLLRFDNNRYSVAASAVGRPVEIRAYRAPPDSSEMEWTALHGIDVPECGLLRPPRNGPSAMSLIMIGLDTAKAVFHVHGVNETGKAALRRKLRRSELLGFFETQPACTVVLEACGAAHHWGRVLTGLGHTVKLIAPEAARPS